MKLTTRISQRILPRCFETINKFGSTIVRPHSCSAGSRNEPNNCCSSTWNLFSFGANGNVELSILLMDDEYISWDVHCAITNHAVENFRSILERELSLFREKIRSAGSTHESDPLSNRNSPTGSGSNCRASVNPTDTLTLGERRQLAADAISAAVESNEAVANLTDVLQNVKAQVAECERFLQSRVATSNVVKRTERTQLRRESSRSKLHQPSDTPSKPSASLQRKATLAAFRKASAAIASRSSLNTEATRAPVNDKPTQSLSAATAENYFSADKRDEILRELADVAGQGCDPDILARLQVAANGERQLFDDAIALMSAVHDQDHQMIENLILRQRMRLQAADSHISKLVSSELQRLMTGPHQGSIEPARGNQEDNESDTASSDSDVLESRDIELTRMTDGSIRVSVGLQAELPSSTDLDLQAVGGVLRVALERESQTKNSLDSMASILRSLERCNEAFEADFFCASCRASFVDFYLLWPCGHQFCLDCVYRHELPSGGYFCVECQSSTFEIPVPNIPVNDVVARMSFKRSGVHGLFDVISRFRKESFSAESSERGSIAGLHLGFPVPSPVE